MLPVIMRPSLSGSELRADRHGPLPRTLTVAVCLLGDQTGVSLRSSNIFKKTPREKRKLQRGEWRKYRRAAAREQQRAIERMFGSQGPASAVRKIDPTTGEVVGIIEAHPVR